MKKIILSLVALMAVVLVSCGSKEISQVEAAVKAAIEQTNAANSAQEVAVAGQTLEFEMVRIQNEAGDKFALTGDANALLEEYQETVKKKLAEFGFDASGM